MAAATAVVAMLPVSWSSYWIGCLWHIVEQV